MPEKSEQSQFGVNHKAKSKIKMKNITLGNGVTVKVIRDHIRTIKGIEWTVLWTQEAGYETVRLLRDGVTLEPYDCETVLEAQHTFNTVRDTLIHIQRAYGYEGSKNKG